MPRLRRTVVALAVALVSCTAGAPETRPSPTGDPGAWRTEESEPYPFVTPVPLRTETPLDGLYGRDYRQGSIPIPCRRCAPYRLDRGPSTLELRAGRFYVRHEAADFSTRGHFLVEEGRLLLFNDPNCPTTTGVYAWTLEDGTLTLKALEDPCAFDLLRARYLSAAPWEA